jgi:uncharacterized protein YbjT (DUF2867 family)
VFAAMKVLIFGATGMVGQGVLGECQRDPAVTSILLVSRRASGLTHPKTKEILHQDFADLGPIAAELQGVDACFYCLGVSAAGLDEAAYRKITYDFTLAAAKSLESASPGSVFCYVSGMGTDSTEKGRAMWARVKGRTENALLGMPFGGVYLFRPGLIQPLDGIKSSTGSYRVLYAMMGPFFPVMRALAPRSLTTTRAVGLAMLAVAKQRPPSKILFPPDINELSAPPSPGP